MIVKLQWKPKKSTEAPFAVDVPGVFKQAFVMERTARNLPRVADGDTPFSTTTPHRTSLRPMPKAFPTADTHATPP